MILQGKTVIVSGVGAGLGNEMTRAALRDVGRVLQMPYGQVDKLCKMVPQNPAAPVTLARAIEDEPKLQAEADIGSEIKGDSLDAKLAKIKEKAANSSARSQLDEMKRQMASRSVAAEGASGVKKSI